MNYIPHAIHCWQLFAVALVCFGLDTHAQAKLILSRNEIVFNADNGIQQDIRITNHSKENQYVVAKTYEILGAGLSNQQEALCDDPEKAGILMAPEKTVFAGETSQILRVVLLEPLADHRRIFRITVNPMINESYGTSEIKLKTLPGSTLQVILQPDDSR